MHLLATIPAFLFFAMGIAALAAPERILHTFGTDRLTPAGRNEVRAVYGGFGVAVAATLIAGIVAEDIRTGVFVAVAAALGGMAGGRLAGAAADRRIDAAPLLFLSVELVMALLLVLAAAA